jgi:hypothetical protein
MLLIKAAFSRHTAVNGCESVASAGRTCQGFAAAAGGGGGGVNITPRDVLLGLLGLRQLIGGLIKIVP